MTPTEALITQLRAGGDSKEIIGRICYLEWGWIESLIRAKIPERDVEDRVMVVIDAAMRSTFNGVSEGEFRVWLKRIIQRRGIADFHRSLENKPKIAQSLDQGETESDDPMEFESAVGDPSESIALQAIVGQNLSRLSRVHRQVVWLNIFQDLAADRVVEEVNKLNPGRTITVMNVHKIASRWRDRLRKELAAYV